MTTILDTPSSTYEPPTQFQDDEYYFASKTGQVILKLWWNEKHTRGGFELFDQQAGAERIRFDMRQWDWQQDIWPNKFEWQDAMTRDAVLEAFNCVEM